VRSAIRVRDDFVTIPFPRLASISNQQIAQAAESYKHEAAIIDPRLSHEVICAFKGTALSDVCDRLRAETGIQLTAGPSVADEKVTVFCEKLPLREVMRQLSRPFGYTWLRSKREGGEYRYELVQDLRSQLLEEELRNRDRNEALLALDQKMNRYRPYLDLSPDQALAKAKTAPPGEKELLEHLATDGWGLIQMWFRLSPNEMAALRAGQRLIFSQEPKADEQPLPADLARGILQSERDNRIFERDGAFRLGDATHNPDGMLATAVPEARAKLMLRMPQSELGEFTLTGGPGVFISAGSQTPGGFSIIGSAGSLAIGRSPAVLDPNNSAANAPLARDPALQGKVTLSDFGFWILDFGLPAKSKAADVRAPVPDQSKIQNPKSKMTSADVLEALHRATGRPIVSDFYTRLYPLPTVTVRNLPLLDALNRLSDAMRLRWGKDGAWLQFRGTGFFNDRLKEVPNRLLSRWSASRRQHGSATLDDLIEMAQLSDAQLDAVDMMEGAKECWGLAEWDLVHRSSFRPQLRYLAGFTPEQRRLATSPSGLSFTRLSLAQQQQFLSFFVMPGASQLPSGEELTGATLRVDYSLPGAFQWAPPESGWRQFLPPPVRERTRDAALRAALRIEPQATETQIAPTSLALSFLYTPGGPNVDVVRMVRTDRDGWWQP
jgi:hypothetical protein